MDLVFQLALQYGQGQLTEAGIAYAMEKLGIAAPENTTEIDILTGGGINQAFSPGSLTNMFKRAGLRLGANTLMKGAGSSLLPFAGIAGLAMLGNKYRKKLTGYDTQSAYEAARDQRIADKRLDKITDRIIDGKDYGNYEEALLDSSAGAVEIDGTIYSGPDYQGGDNNNNNGSTDSPGSTGSKDNSKGGMGTASFGQSFHARRGGIASL